MSSAAGGTCQRLRWQWHPLPKASAAKGLGRKLATRPCLSATAATASCVYCRLSAACAEHLGTLAIEGELRPGCSRQGRWHASLRCCWHAGTYKPEQCRFALAPQLIGSTTATGVCRAMLAQMQAA